MFYKRLTPFNLVNLEICSIKKRYSSFPEYLIEKQDMLYIAFFKQLRSGDERQLQYRLSELQADVSRETLVKLLICKFK